MSLTLEFSRQAKETYAAIQSQLNERFGHTVLEKFERKTVKTLDSILQSPLMFKSVTDNPNIRNHDRNGTGVATVHQHSVKTSRNYSDSKMLFP